MSSSKVTEDNRIGACAVDGGYDVPEAEVETPRCLHCDCKAKDNCDLRDISELVDADQNRFRGDRRQMRPLNEGERVHLELGKCIACGLCIQIAHNAKEEIGLAYEGRGFNTQIIVPFGKTMTEALAKSAHECADACPTGAISVSEEMPTTRNPWDNFQVQNQEQGAKL